MFRHAAKIAASAFFACLIWTVAAGAPIHSDAVEIVDGDTIRIDDTTYRLVPFDAPETVRARCERERDLAERAVTRLQELVDAGPLDLESVSCSCRPGTHGTKACNHGRACGILLVGGRNVGDILIGEGLARPYHCGANSCPRRQGWCG